MSKLFVTSGFWESGSLSSDEGRAIDFRSIPPFLRVLLSTDGTVTKSLESFFWEPISVTKVRQQVTVLNEDLHLLAKNRGDSILERQISLVGGRSKKEYGKAKSYLCLDLLPDKIAKSLLLGEIGIGELLREQSLETYREIVQCGYSHDDRDAQIIWRTYLILYDKRPIIQITESFPLSLYW